MEVYPSANVQINAIGSNVFCFNFDIFDHLFHRQGTTLNHLHTCPKGTSLMCLLAPILWVIYFPLLLKAHYLPLVVS